MPDARRVRGYPADPVTGRAVLGGLAKRSTWRRRTVLVRSRSGTRSHLLAIERRGPTLCGMVADADAEPSTIRDVCASCRRLFDRLVAP